MAKKKAKKADKPTDKSKKAPKASLKKKTSKKAVKLADPPVVRKKSTKPSARTAPVIAMALTHDQIAARAYEVYVRNGRIPGQDEHNWRTAERELLAERAR